MNIFTLSLFASSSADFCLLIFAVCQQRVFEIEFADGADSYEGGSNKEIVHEDQASLVNPIPDFVTYSRWVVDMSLEL